MAWKLPLVIVLFSFGLAVGAAPWHRYVRTAGLWLSATVLFGTALAAAVNTAELVDRPIVTVTVPECTGGVSAIWIDEKGRTHGPDVAGCVPPRP